MVLAAVDVVADDYHGLVKGGGRGLPRVVGGCGGGVVFGDVGPEVAGYGRCVHGWVREVEAVLGDGAGVGYLGYVVEAGGVFHCACRDDLAALAFEEV